MKRRRGRRHKQLVDDLKEMRGYWKLKAEALDSVPWRTCFASVHEPVGRQATERSNKQGRRRNLPITREE